MKFTAMTAAQRISSSSLNSQGARHLSLFRIAQRHGLTIVPLDEAESQGRSWAYVALVDNVTNDPTNWW